MPAPMAGAELTGLRVLVVESDFLIACEIERALAERGATVLGPMKDPGRALAQVEADPPDVAVLNLGLGEGSAAPVAEALRARGVAFVIVSGFPEAHEPGLRDAPLLQKPVPPEELAGAVARAAGVVG